MSVIEEQQAALTQHSASDNKSPGTRHFSFSPFDRAVILVIGLLVLLIAGTILLGDRVGVQLSQVAPLGDAASTSPITIRFSEAMDHDSAAAHFSLDPEVPGNFVWSGSTLMFKPAEALTPGSTYTVSLTPGAVSESGRAVLTEFQYSFTVRQPQIAYLSPADGSPHNIWIVDPADPEHPAQITDSPTGIDDLSVSPDGTRIAFTEANPDTGGSDIKMITLANGALQQLTNCQKALCNAPVWRPDGKMIAYARIEYDQQFGSSPPRIWLIDLSSTPATTRTLFQQSQILGYDAQWSADGSRIALVDKSSVSILVYDFSTGKIVSISSQAGESGALSPDGTRLIFPDITFSPNGGTLSKLKIAVLDTGEFTVLTTVDDPFSDQRAQWSPDGTKIAIARKDTSTNASTQIVVYDLRTGETTPVTDDPRYANMFFWWNATGTRLVVQRFPELDENMQFNPNGVPELWTLDLASGSLTKIVTNGYLPHWVP